MAADEDGPENNIIEYSIICDYGEDGSDFGFLIDANSGDLRFNNTMGENYEDYDCIINVSEYFQDVVSGMHLPFPGNKSRCG